MDAWVPEAEGRNTHLWQRVNARSLLGYKMACLSCGSFLQALLIGITLCLSQ